MLFAVISFFSILISAKTAIAVPGISDVSGDIGNGLQITVNGYGFKTKTQPAPVSWNNFEAQNLGEHAPAGWTAKDYTYGLVSNSDSHSGAKSLQFDVTGDEWNQISRDFGESDVFYLSAWHKLVKRDTNNQFQWKMWYVSSSSGVYALNEEPTTTHYSQYGWWSGTYPAYYDPLNNKFGWNNNSFFFAYDGGTYGAILSATRDTYPDLNQWFRMETVIIRSSGPLAMDGKMLLYVNGRLKRTITDAITHDDNDGRWRYVMINNAFCSYLDAAQIETHVADLTLYMDDLYVDTSQSRVELGDSPEWDSCTHREIQIPVAWSDSSVMVIFNQGSFNAGDTAYIYIVDDDGNVNSNGYSITIGDSSGSNPPAAPTGLIAN